MTFFNKYHLSILLPIAYLLNIGITNSQSCIGEQGELDWFLFENIEDPEWVKLLAEPGFPTGPDWVEEVSSLATSPRYYNKYGSLVRGFIKAPETGAYTFNTTGDDQCLFYLSTDSLKANMALICEVPSRTGTTEHTKFSQQTSTTINLAQDEYYYFELRHIEDSGEEFSTVFWKTPTNNTNWDAIGPDHIYRYSCAAYCPVAGTPCNDGDPTTEDDLEDGYCHCLGTPISKPNCVGERGSLLALYYDGISGQFVQEMYNDPDYPLSPDRGQFLKRMEGPLVRHDDDLYGTRVRGYLRVPVTGKYLFNSARGR